MMESAIIFFVILWVSLFYIESSASKNTRLSKYAWLAYASRPMLFFGGIGLLIIATDIGWGSSFWDYLIGLLLITIGIAISVHDFLRRKEIQAKLKSGEIKPSGN